MHRGESGDKTASLPGFLLPRLWKARLGTRLHTHSAEGYLLHDEFWGSHSNGYSFFCQSLKNIFIAYRPPVKERERRKGGSERGREGGREGGREDGGDKMTEVYKTRSLTVTWLLKVLCPVIFT